MVLSLKQRNNRHCTKPSWKIDSQVENFLRGIFFTQQIPFSAIYYTMIYILVQGVTANVFTVLACAELFQLLEGGELLAVDETNTAQCE